MHSGEGKGWWEIARILRIFGFHASRALLALALLESHSTRGLRASFQTARRGNAIYDLPAHTVHRWKSDNSGKIDPLSFRPPPHPSAVPGMNVQGGVPCLRWRKRLPSKATKCASGVPTSPRRKSKQTPVCSSRFWIILSSGYYLRGFLAELISTSPRCGVPFRGRISIFYEFHLSHLRSQNISWYLKFQLVYFKTKYLAHKLHYSSPWHSKEIQSKYLYVLALLFWEYIISNYIVF